MTRAETIRPEELAWIRVCFNTRRLKSTKNNLKRMLRESGGDFLMNAAIFLRNGQPCCHLKADGKVRCAPSYTAWGISWNTPEDFGVKKVPNSDANYMECVHAIVDGRKIEPMNYGRDMGYRAHRTAVGVKEGRFAYYSGQLKQTPEQLRDMLASWGWSDAIMMDGGGSTCFMDKNGEGFTGDGRVIPFFLVVKRRDPEPKGEKPMVTINGYSKAKDGEKKLSANFHVREFACKDGSDPILVAPRLVMVLQTIRDHFGKPLVINSGYRTPQYNEKVDGAAQSQHCHGTAADITLKGVTPAAVAAYARKLMPDWGGVGVYSWGIHVDVREKKADWSE